MAQSVFKMPLAHARLQRNAFDLSNSELLTQSLGQLLPVFVREVNPNEHIRIRPELYARTQPLNTSAFVNIKQNIEFFFVPYRLLWSHSQTFFPKTDYGVSTLINSTAPRYAPNIKIKTINEFLKFLASNNVKDDLGYDFGSGSVRLLDLLGYGDFSEMNSADANPGDSRMAPNVLRLLAYQKIYQDFYRNEVLEPQDMSSYNCDKLFQEQFSTGELIDVIDQMYGVLVDKMKPMFKLRYRNLRSDYFTSARPTFNGASWMSQRIVSPSFTSYGTGNSALPIPRDQDRYSGTFLGALGGYDESGTFGPISNISIANLRSAYALDKLYSNMAHAKDGCYAHQIEARFGVSPNLDDYHCRYIGGSEAPVQIGEVVGTSSDNLGDIGGKGTSYNQGNNIEFDIKEHGVIMGIQSFLLMQDYAANGLDRMNAKTSFEDFLQPEFDELGYQPIYRYELASPISSDSLASNVFAYSPRYAEYKSCVNRIHGNFRKGRSLSSWASQVDLIRDAPQGVVTSSISWQFLKCNPNILDSIMTVAFDGSLDTDQIFSRNHFDCQIIRPISVYGSPYFG